MDIKIDMEAHVSVAQVVKAMSLEEAGDFCSEFAEKFDQNFDQRRYAAREMACGLSELGARFLAEVLAAHYANGLS